MSEKLIVINAGSSSLKFNVYQIPDAETVDVNDLSYLYGGQVSGIDRVFSGGAVSRFSR